MKQFYYFNTIKSDDNEKPYRNKKPNSAEQGISY